MNARIFSAKPNDILTKSYPVQGWCDYHLLRPLRGRYRLAHPTLLRIHAALAKVIEASGVGEFVQQILRDAEEITALSGDFPTDLTSFFATRGLIEVV